jgi:hypothetical protein
MKTIKMYTRENFISTSGKEFSIYKRTNNVGETVFLISDIEGNEFGYRKSKKSIVNFLARN